METGFDDGHQVYRVGGHEMADLRNLGRGMPKLVQEATVTVPRTCPYTEPLSIPIGGVLSLVLLFMGWKVWSSMVDV